MALSGIQIYKLLPQTNCKECGFPTCLAFAMKLAAKQVELSSCPYVSAESKTHLGESSAPPIRLITLKADGNEVKAGNEVGSGGLFNNQKNPAKPLKVADKPIGEWNRFRILMAGEKCHVFLNGELVVNNTTLENYWDRSQPIFPSGQIELQAHTTPVWFKNIYLREIK
jgi:hypothetical protein